MSNDWVEHLYLWLILIPLMLSVAKQLWNFPFHYLKHFKLRTLEGQLEKFNEEDSDIKALLKARHSEEASGVFLGKKLSLRQQSILRKESEKYSIPLAMFNPGWRFVKFNLKEETISINFKWHDNFARIYFLITIFIAMGAVMANLMKAAVEAEPNLPWPNLLIASVMSLITFLHVRGHISGYNLKKHIESIEESKSFDSK